MPDLSRPGFERGSYGELRAVRQDLSRELLAADYDVDSEIRVEVSVLSGVLGLWFEDAGSGSFVEVACSLYGVRFVLPAAE